MVRRVRHLVRTVAAQKRIMSKMADASNPKQLAGYKAVDDHVKTGMAVGLGTGSTAFFAVERVGQLLKEGKLTDVVCVPTSERTKAQAESLSIPLTTLDELDRPLDVAIDGADSVDRSLCLVKGGGGAMLREKMVELSANNFVCIVDESKLVASLGTHFALPVEITPFCHQHTMRKVGALPGLEDADVGLRRGDCSNNKPEPEEAPAVTDNGNYVIDVTFKSDIADVPALANQLERCHGVVDHGLFVNMCSQVSLEQVFECTIL